MTEALNTSTGILVADDSTSVSGYDTESGVSSTQSLSDSILETTYANGRTYHRKSQGKYFQPTDETELDRLDMAHHLYLHLLDGNLHTAPLEDKQLHHVLDCGTGTGIWALDFGEVHPEAQVLGVDLAPTQPSWVFPNVVFETDDIEKEWLWKQKFDFIHGRNLGTSIKDWPRFAKQMFEHASPGGWVELVDHGIREMWYDDNSVPDNSAVALYMKHLSTSLEANGMNADVSADFFKKILEDAGFIDIQVTVRKMPFGAWPKDKKYKKAGRIVAETIIHGFEAYGMAAMISVGTPPDQAKKICRDAVEVVLSGKEHWYNRLFCVAGKKPEALNQ